MDSVEGSRATRGSIGVHEAVSRQVEVESVKIAGSSVTKQEDCSIRCDAVGHAIGSGEEVLRIFREHASGLRGPVPAINSAVISARVKIWRIEIEIGRAHV